MNEKIKQPNLGKWKMEKKRDGMNMGDCQKYVS